MPTATSRRESRLACYRASTERSDRCLRLRSRRTSRRARFVERAYEAKGGSRRLGAGWLSARCGLQQRAFVARPRGLVGLARRKGVRSLGDLKLAEKGTVIATAWPSPRRVLAVVQRPFSEGKLQLMLVEPVRREVLSRRRLTARREVVDVTTTSDGLALLTAPRDSVGPTRLIVARADGSIRSARIGPAARRSFAAPTGHTLSTGGGIRRWPLTRPAGAPSSSVARRGSPSST